MLSPQQIAHFDTFGFLLLRQAFSPAEIQAILQEAEELWRIEREQRHLGPGYLTMAPFIERRPALTRLAEDDRIYDAIEDLLGPGFLWAGSEGNTGVPKDKTFLPWHSDRAGEETPNYRRAKIMMYLTPVRRETGCLRVVPGSHKPPLYHELYPLNSQQDTSSEQVFAVSVANLPGFPLETDPGDVVIFNHYIYHAVVGGDEKRRYIAMKFASRPQNEAQVDLLRKSSASIFKPDEVFLRSDRPRIRAMVDGLVELGAQS
ncbi:MAG: hypothetical protein EXR62_12780 [Chloroflexi bacterium]|nr:hypothetical protein [Chloroflexota bacterium]